MTCWPVSWCVSWRNTGATMSRIWAGPSTAGRPARDRLAHVGFRPAVDGAAQILDIVEPVFLQETHQLTGHHVIGRDHAFDVAQHLTRQSHAGADDVEHLLRGLAGLVELQDR